MVRMADDLIFCKASKGKDLSHHNPTITNKFKYNSISSNRSHIIHTSTSKCLSQLVIRR